MPELALWDWSKGWHPEKPEAFLEPGELQEALNVIYRETQVPEKRRGFQALRAFFGAGRVDGLVRYKPVNENAYWVFAYQGALYRLYDGGAIAQIPGSTGLLAGQDYYFTVWKDRLFVVNGADGLLMWDGVTLTNLTTTPPPPPSQPSGFPISGTISSISDSNATITDNAHDWAAEGVVPGDVVLITSGIASGQERVISDIDGAKITVASAFSPAPVSGDTFEVRTIVQDGASAPAGAKYIVQYADRLWIGGTAAEPDRIFYSRLLDELNWNDPETGIDNLVDVSVGDNKPITGLVRARETLMIFKERAIFYLRGYLPEEWVLDRISDDLGCIAPRSIVELDSTIVWLSHKGVYMDDGSTFRRIGGPVDNWIEETLTIDQRRKAVAVLSGLHYILHFPDTLEGPVCLVWNGRLDNWVKWSLASGLTFSVMALDENGGWVAAGNTNALFWAGDTGGTDDGVNIDARIRSGVARAPALHEEYLLRRVAVQAQLATGDSASVHLYSSGVPVGGSDTILDGVTFISVPPGQLARQVSFAVVMSGSGLGSKVLGVTADMRLRRVRWA